jgi:hypothetical protein
VVKIPKIAAAFGVTPEIVREWIRSYGMYEGEGRDITISKTLKAPRAKERHGGIMSEDHERVLRELDIQRRKEHVAERGGYR